MRAVGCSRVRQLLDEELTHHGVRAIYATAQDHECAHRDVKAGEVAQD